MSSADETVSYVQSQIRHLARSATLLEGEWSQSVGHGEWG